MPCDADCAPLYKCLDHACIPERGDVCRDDRTLVKVDEQVVRETFREDSTRSLSQLVDVLCSVDLLHIDDVGAEQTTPWVLEQLYTVVNTRYEEQRAVIVTTNLIGTDTGGDVHPAAPLREQIGERTVSRLYEMCGEPFPMFGDDQRLEKEFKLPAPMTVSRTPDPFDDANWDDDRPRYGRAP